MGDESQDNSGNGEEQKRMTESTEQTSSPSKDDLSTHSKSLEKFKDFFDENKLRDGQRIVSAREHHGFFKGIGHRPRHVVVYDPDADGYLIYRSRGHRKNRRMEFQPRKGKEEMVITPSVPTLFLWDWNNISWHVAVYFTLGSVCWIVNGQYALMQDSSTHVTNAIAYSGFAGGMLFWIGAYLAVVEALNENRNQFYGAALKRLEHHIEKYKHFHARRLRKLRKRINVTKGDEEKALTWLKQERHVDKGVAWRWIGYTPSVGYWASVIQFIGATLFAIAVICGIPGVIGATEWQLQQTFIWTMQTAGSVFFIISSWILMVEEQPNWYMPACARIGWQSAFWNLVGAIGFLLSAVFGYLANWEGNGVVCCQLWGTAFNTYWGSWAFLIASVLLYYEVESKQPASFSENCSLLKSWCLYKCHHVLGCSCCGKDVDDDKEESNGTKEELV
ncbi:hypothetical protein PSENEW3_00006093 [Picochlorum sp. SENEW3]|nr:hypothetical protein PSENEW3_00006093 [Picochlorum sp. SENEW3]